MTHNSHTPPIDRGQMPDTIVLFSGGAADGLVTALTPGFLAETGAGIQGTFGAVGAMRERLRQGEAADLVILTRPIIDEMAAAGLVQPDSVRDIGLVQTAIAVRDGDPIPAVGTPEHLKSALLAADEIHFPDPALATAGIHFSKVLDRLGLARSKVEALRVHANGATAMRALAASASRAPIGCTQVTEIIITPGTRLVAALPGDLGLSTTYTAAVLRDAAHTALAQTFIAQLSGPGSAEKRKQAGFA
jgi:molybdate transport system substrate-binding protein